MGRVNYYEENDNYSVGMEVELSCDLCYDCRHVHSLELPGTEYLHGRPFESHCWGSDEVIVNGSGPDMSIIDAKARMGCAAHDKTASAVISSTCVDQNCIRKRYLYACQ